MSVRVITGDVREKLRDLPDESVHCVITSPPYWGLRDYGVAGQLGLEPTLGEHVSGMVEVFREVRRVLRADGTLWLNYGDSYATSINGRSAAETKTLGIDDRTFRDKPFSTVGPIYEPQPASRQEARRGRSGNLGNGGINGINVPSGCVVAGGFLKPKDLCGVPWRVAFALQDDGWWLRQDIIWSKPNPMPESVRDRFTKAHEYLFLLAKSKRYYFDQEAIKEGRSSDEDAVEFRGGCYVDGEFDTARHDIRPSRAGRGSAAASGDVFGAQSDAALVAGDRTRVRWPRPHNGHARLQRDFGSRGWGTATMTPLRLEPNADPLAKLQSTEAEQALLGAIFCNNRAYEHVADILGPEDFSYAVHGRIFGAIGTLISSGAAATPVTLKPMFDQDEALKGIGTSYLIKLAASAVTVLNSRSYAETIADLARRRELIMAAQDIIGDAAIVDIERPADMVLDEAEERLFQISDRSAREGTMRSLGDVLVSTLKDMEDAYRRGGAITIDTGLVDLDRIISGMGAGDLVVLAGRPAMGKSAAAGTMALNAARQGKKTLIFSLEMSRAELSQRWLAGITEISTDRQRHGRLDERDWTAVMEANMMLSQLPIMVDDQPRLSVPQMRQRARRVRRRHGLDLIIIDHLQLVRQQGKQESRRVEIGDASSMLKAIAKELRVPVLLLSQLSRAPEQREDKRPQLSDLKESGDIEQDADVVMFLFREEYYLERAEPRRRQNETQDAFNGRLADWQEDCRRARGLAEIAVAKNRHGRTGVAHVVFDGERQRFENLAR